jgi:hypothetical protein
VVASYLVSKMPQIEKCNRSRSGENGGHSHTLQFQRSLALKAKVHLFGLGALVHGGRALASSPGVAVAALAATAAEIFTPIWVITAISAMATPTAATAFSERLQTGAAALWRGPGHCPRAQASPRPKLAAYLPLRARNLKELLCGLASSIITRPPPTPIQNVYLLQVLTLISIGQGGQSRSRITVCCDW